MLEEEGLHCGKDTARPALILVDAVLDLLVEEEALLPRVVEVAFPVFEEQLGHALTFLV